MKAVIYILVLIQYLSLILYQAISKWSFPEKDPGLLITEIIIIMDALILFLVL